MKKHFILIILIITHYSLFITHCNSQWMPQSIPVNKPVIGLEFTDENTGWAITENTSLTDTAYILNSTNGGTNWYVQFKGNIGLQSMDAINENICYAGGVDANGDALFLKTTNTGLNWIVSNIGANKVPDDMFFLNKDTGYICDNFSGGVYLTTDAGSTWINRQSGIFAFPKTLYFLNYDTGYCGGSFYLFKTTNAGLNWNQLFQFGENVLDIQFIDQNQGWTALSGNKIGKTISGGLNWDIVNASPISLGDVLDISFLNTLIGWAGSQSVGYIFKSLNGGYNWINQVDSSGSRKRISVRVKEMEIYRTFFLKKTG